MNKNVILNMDNIEEVLAEDVKIKPKHNSKSGGLSRSEKKREQDFRKNRKNARGRKWQGD